MEQNQTTEFLTVAAVGEIQPGERIHEVQMRVDPKLGRSLPPHITLVGSSGIGPYLAEYSATQLREHLQPICASTPPLALPFGIPHRFPQTDIIVLPLTRPTYWAPSMVMLSSAPRSRPSVMAALVPLF